MGGLSPVPQKIPNFSGEADGCHGRFEDNEVKVFVESCQSDLWYLLPTCDSLNKITTDLYHLQQPVLLVEYHQEEPDVEVRVEESGDGGDSINTATAPISPSLSKAQQWLHAIFTTTTSYSCSKEDSRCYSGVEGFNGYYKRKTKML
ncbi:unnamed protein product [Lactuca saligna]|uniref:Uncharacterized protein n=1 Tax=Lactuca saligna TaxID=75948 RepID=A0AA36A1U6_LACSI|nr:unnamed protein product [Lactuca saligna]